MKIQNKILAREIIILFSLLGLICLFYFGIEVWNWNVNRNIAKIEESIRVINKELSINTQRIDSVKNQTQSQEPPDKLLWAELRKDQYPSDYNRFKEVMSNPAKRAELHKILVNDGNYSKTYDEFEKQFFSSYLTNKDNPIYAFAKENGLEIYDASSYELVLRTLHGAEYADWDWDEFRNKVVIKYGEYGSRPIKTEDIPILTQYLEIQNSKQKAKDSVNIVRNRVESELIPYQHQTRLIFNFALIGFLLVYVLRGIIFSLKWSIKTLKEQ